MKLRIRRLDRETETVETIKGLKHRKKRLDWGNETGENSLLIILKLGRKRIDYETETLDD